MTELRRRKHRDEKPFAIMVGDIAGAREICEIAPAEEALLASPRRRSSCCGGNRARGWPRTLRREIPGWA